jgi:LysR family transcriptional regulator, benzoate and cis,cis-muconate-responsive activator of ben and cat genes
VQLRQLESFLAVVEEGQFARAAARLFLSPPAVTGHVRQLERELGTPLLRRSPVELTPAGIRLVPHARTMVAAAKAASDSIRDTGEGCEETLRVGVMTPGATELTPAILRSFSQAQPQIHLTVEGLDYADFTSAVIEHRVDAAFVRPAPQDERITTDVLTLEPRVVIAPAWSELAEADGLYLSDVLDHDFVRFPDSTPRALTDYGTFAAARNGTPPKWAMDQAGTAHDLMTSIAAGWGIAGTLYSLRRFYLAPDICWRPILNAPWDASALVTRRNDPRPQVEAFRRVARLLARTLGPKLLPASGLPASDI